MSVVADGPTDTKETSNLMDGCADLVKSGCAGTHSIGEVRCASSGSEHRSSRPCTKDSDDEGKSTSNVMLINPFAQALVGGASANDDKVSGAGRLARERCGSVEWSRLPIHGQAGVVDTERFEGQLQDGSRDDHWDAFGHTLGGMLMLEERRTLQKQFDKRNHGGITSVYI